MTHSITLPRYSATFGTWHGTTYTGKSVTSAGLAGDATAVTFQIISFFGKDKATNAARWCSTQVKRWNLASAWCGDPQWHVVNSKGWKREVSSVSREEPACLVLVPLKLQTKACQPHSPARSAPSITSVLVLVKRSTAWLQPVEDVSILPPAVHSCLCGHCLWTQGAYRVDRLASARLSLPATQKGI